MNESTSGFCLFHKRAGVSSFKAMAPFKKKYRGFKTGFAGTLDPAAAGLLIIGVGKATRLLDFFTELPKKYTVEVLPGKTSDTYDDDGKITEGSSVEYPTREAVTEALKKFTGKMEQMPPVYSAIKVKGKRACDRVRRGEDVELQARPIQIYSLSLLEWQEKKWKLEVECSKGTYIRSLAHDLGEHLGCGALASQIVRTAIGSFTLDKAIFEEDLENNVELLPPEAALSSLEKIELDLAAAKQFVHGQKVTLKTKGEDLPNPQGNQTVQVHGFDIGFLGLGDIEEETLNPHKIFVTPEIFNTSNPEAPVS